MDHDYGPVQTYEITWRSGHVEQVLAHQVTWPNRGISIASGLFGALTTETTQSNYSRIQFHAEIDGKWLLTLAADEDDIASIRLVTTPEAIPGVAS